VARKAPFEKTRRWVDTETTGLDLDKHEIIEIAITDETGNVLVNTKVQPQRIETASEIALQINGYTPEKWADAPMWEDVAEQILTHLEGAVIFGQNVQFDYNRIKKALIATLGEEKCKKLGYHLVDTVTLSWEHLAPYGLKSLSLGAVCEFLGIEHGDAHTALADVQACRKVYHKLLRAGPLRRWWWSMRYRWRK